MLRQVNPWISMWGDPRSTIRSIVETNPRLGVVWLASIYVLQFFFYFFSQLHLTISIYAALIWAVVLSPFLGVFWLYFTGSIFYWIGRFLNGRAPMSYVIAAIAWSKIPMSISLLMWFVLLVAAKGVELLYYPNSVAAVFIVFIAAILSLWSWALLIQSIREVQGFSIRRALLNIGLAYFVFFLIFIFIYLLIF